MIRKCVKPLTAAGLMVFLLLGVGGTSTTTLPTPIQASTVEDDGGSDGDEGGGNDESNNNSESNDGGEEEDNSGGATTPVTPPDEGEESAKEQAEGSDNGDNDNNDDREPLPYCGNEAPGQSCHDIDDVDEVTGKYPCNDGTQRTNKEDCPDATQPVLPTQPNLKSPLSRTIVATYTIQGSGLAEQTGPVPVPKEGQAVLMIFYEDDWTSNILDSNGTSQSYDGKGNYSIVFPCDPDSDNFGGFFSLTAQKGDDDNVLMKLVVQNHLNQTLKQGQTSAEFGAVSLSGECGIS